MKIATWNVNSIRARHDRVLRWLERHEPDVLCLQELKVTEANFPLLSIEAAGYKSAVLGQKTYNGVAILSKHPIEDVARGLPGDEADEQARYIEATIGDLRVAAIYLPNGNPVDSEKYPYKLAWMDRLIAHVRDDLLPVEQPFVLGGDYNVIPADLDVYDPKAWIDDALFRPETRVKFRALVHLGLTEAWRALHAEHGYSFWDYQGGRWARGEGLRIDHFLLCPRAADRLRACEIDSGPRGKEKASDHTPVWCEIGEAA